MESDSSHEFGEVISAVIYIVIFALAVGLGMISVQDAIRVTKEYNVEHYIVLNQILGGIRHHLDERGVIYLSADFVNNCFSSKKKFEECLNLNLPPNVDYYVAVYKENGENPHYMLKGKGKIKYRVPILLKEKNIKTFGWIEIGVNK